MNEQDNFFEMAEQQILFYLYDHKDRAVSKAELWENIGFIGAKATFESILLSLKVRSSSRSMMPTTWLSHREVLA